MTTNKNHNIKNISLFQFGLYANPIINGDWPQEVIDRVKERSGKEKLKHSRLPAFTKEEKADIKGSIDFMALNYFDTRIVADSKEADYKTSSYANDMKVEISANPDWPVDAAGNTVITNPLFFIIRQVDYRMQRARRHKYFACI